MIFRAENLSLQDIMESGQCFRMTRDEQGWYRILAGDHFVKARELDEGRFEFCCTREQFDGFWAGYLDLDTDYGKILAAIPPEDEFLSRAAAYGKNLRILRQDVWEMIITFILSQRRSIPAIRKSVETLCRRFGAPMGEGLYAFPTPQALAGATEGALRDCALGYRAPYVLSTARMVSRGQADLTSFEGMDDAHLLEALKMLPGVGDKVARCIMLFGCHRLAAAPVDVWIQRVIDERYGGETPFHRYGPWAGVMQQYMFFYRRSPEGGLAGRSERK